MISPQDILTALQNGVNGINALTQQLKSVFPQVTASSTVAPSVAGSITYTSSEAAGFLLVALSSGATVKVPFYSQ